MVPASTVLHKKKKRIHPSCSVPLPLIITVPETDPVTTMLPQLAIPSRRPPARSFTDDWHRGHALHWGLPNALLGYTTTTKMHFDKAVEQQRRNLRLMRSFEEVNAAVAALQALLQMETGAVLVQTPDRAWVAGQVFSLKNYVRKVLEA
jgi:hypothetical protein